MVIVSCSGKFHAFPLAEQLEQHSRLTAFYTSYAWQKNTLMRRFTSRVDKEQIPAKRIRTFLPVAVMMVGGVAPAVYNELFDRWVARRLARQKDFKVFIGWSGMSLHSIRQAKKEGAVTILERGSSHIQYQDKLLHEEYKKFGIDFRIDPRVVAKERIEYGECDYISIPSVFVKNTFLEYGIPKTKLLVNPYGSSIHFKKTPGHFADSNFRIVYVGSLLIRKGLSYLFQALEMLDIPSDKYEAWFIGKIDDEMKDTVARYNHDNWTFWGHINHYDLPKYLSACDIAVAPSIEDGFGMVISQLLACGVPVITTPNMGGKDILEDANNGYIVPIRDPVDIARKIQRLYEDRELLQSMKNAAGATKNRGLLWKDYGQRYVQTLDDLIA